MVLNKYNRTKCASTGPSQQQEPLIAVQSRDVFGQPPTAPVKGHNITVENPCDEMPLDLSIKRPIDESVASCSKSCPTRDIIEISSRNIAQNKSV